jgi:hypothetical protein
MRVNVYAEEMTDQVEIISKEVEGQEFTGLRFWLQLPVTYKPMLDGGIRPVSAQEDGEGARQLQGPFMHRPGDDDSSAVTFWGKRDLRVLLRQALDRLDRHYTARHYGAPKPGDVFEFGDHLPGSIGPTDLFGALHHLVDHPYAGAFRAAMTRAGLPAQAPMDLSIAWHTKAECWQVIARCRIPEL